MAVLTWDLGTNGYWISASKWAPLHLGFPGTGDIADITVAGQNGPYDVTVIQTNYSGGFEAGQLLLGPDARFHLIGGCDFMLGEAAENRGFMAIHSDFWLGYDATTPVTVTFSSGQGTGGVMELSTHEAAAIIHGRGINTLVNQNHTIRGNGTIEKAHIVNATGGVIQASRVKDINGNDVAGMLLIDPQGNSGASGGGVNNNGVLEAVDGANLKIHSTDVIQQTDGVIRARNGGIVQIDGSEVAGGAMETDGGSIYGTNATLRGALKLKGSFEFDGITNISGTMNAWDPAMLTAFSLKNTLTIAPTQGLTLTGVATMYLDGATIGVGAGGSLTAFDNGWKIAGAGTIGTGNGEMLFRNGAGGTVAPGFGQTISIDTGDPIENNGVLDTTGGTIVVHDRLSGTGSAVTSGNGTLNLMYTVANTQTIVFDHLFGGAAGTVRLWHTFDGAVYYFGRGDTLDLNGIAYNADYTTAMSGAALSLKSGASTVTSLHFYGAAYHAANFHLAADSDGSTLITYTPQAVKSDFDGDGRSDVLFRNASDGVTYLWTMFNETVLGGATTTVKATNAWSVDGVADFDGDGATDLLWSYHNAANASDILNGISYISLQNGANMVGGGVVQQLDSAWLVAGCGDFDGDAKADILYRHAVTGMTYLDVMNGSAVSATSTGETSRQVNDNHWKIIAVADFSGDGMSDVLWRYENASNAADELNGAMYEWTMNGRNVSTGAGLSRSAPINWGVAGTGDFNADGKADILFRYNNLADASDPFNGITYMALMDGSTILDSSDVTQWQVGNAWAVAAVGDYNGDGKSDILWNRPAIGDAYLWNMNGTQVTSGVSTSQQPGVGWYAQNGAPFG